MYNTSNGSFEVIEVFDEDEPLIIKVQPVDARLESTRASNWLNGLLEGSDGIGEIVNIMVVCGNLTFEFSEEVQSVDQAFAALDKFSYRFADAYNNLKPVSDDPAELTQESFHHHDVLVDDASSVTRYSDHQFN